MDPQDCNPGHPAAPIADQSIPSTADEDWNTQPADLPFESHPSGPDLTLVIMPLDKLENRDDDSMTLNPDFTLDHPLETQCVEYTQDRDLEMHVHVGDSIMLLEEGLSVMKASDVVNSSMVHEVDQYLMDASDALNSPKVQQEDQSLMFVSDALNYTMVQQENQYLMDASNILLPSMVQPIDASDELNSSFVQNYQSVMNAHDVLNSSMVQQEEEGQSLILESQNQDILNVSQPDDCQLTEMETQVPEVRISQHENGIDYPIESSLEKKDEQVVFPSNAENDLDEAKRLNSFMEMDQRHVTAMASLSNLVDDLEDGPISALEYHIEEESSVALSLTTTDIDMSDSAFVKHVMHELAAAISSNPADRLSDIDVQMINSTASLELHQEEEMNSKIPFNCEDSAGDHIIDQKAGSEIFSPSNTDTEMIDSTIEKSEEHRLTIVLPLTIENELDNTQMIDLNTLSFAKSSDTLVQKFDASQPANTAFTNIDKLLGMNLVI